jgi:hypothetical protein
MKQLPGKTQELLAGVTVVVGNKNAFMPCHLQKMSLAMFFYCLHALSSG